MLPVPEDVLAMRRDYVERMYNLNAVGGNGNKDVFVAETGAWYTEREDPMGVFARGA